jgi:ribosomal protein L15
MITLPKVVRRPKKRLGRGIGSGKGGHTSSRGQKGQKSRGKIGVLFEGMKVKKSLLKRLPKMRGKGKFFSKLGRREKMANFKTKKAKASK